MSAYNSLFISSINDIDCEIWNTLCGTDYPFLRYEFFHALEKSGSTGIDSGWEPHHLIVSDSESSPEKIVAIFPLFLKHHSYGEYVFDWSWAEAYQRHGLHYYPKLLTAIPFTPASGPRWGFDNTLDEKKLLEYCLNAIKNEAEKQGTSSYHCLFPPTLNHEIFAKHNCLQRCGYQYHWFNQDYENFDDFLSTMSSRKRKNIIKERKKIPEQGIKFSIKTGDEISQDDWGNFYRFYQITYLKRSGHGGYLTPEFFPLLAQSLSSHIVLILAHKEQQTIAAALCFKDKATLYGRYWGCYEEIDCLHFEACYYQGIEYAIKHGLQRFDPGAQGEHKIQRGFTPIKTYSYHWLAHPEFQQAIQQFVRRETLGVDQYIEDAKQLLPFKKSNGA